MRNLLILVLAIASVSANASIIRGQKFRGQYKTTGTACFIEASGNGETWLRGNNFNWIWARRATEDMYVAIAHGDHGTVDKKDTGKEVKAYIDSDGRVVQFDIFDKNKVKTCIISP